MLQTEDLNIRKEFFFIRTVPSSSSRPWTLAHTSCSDRHIVAAADYSLVACF